MKTQYYYSKEQEQLIRDNFHAMTGPELARLVGVKPGALYKKAQLMGLKKLTMRHGKPYLKEIGGRQYWVVTRERRTWFLHRLKWENQNGPIPEGYHLRCKGDYANPEPENWELVSKAEHAHKNHDPVKAGKSIKAKWDKAKRWEAMGLKVHFTRYTGRKVKTHTKVTQHEPHRSFSE
jgi:hypothetical protein